jgi:hypothetical protein
VGGDGDKGANAAVALGLAIERGFAGQAFATNERCSRAVRTAFIYVAVREYSARCVNAVHSRRPRTRRAAADAMNIVRGSQRAGTQTIALSSRTRTTSTDRVTRTTPADGLRSGLVRAALIISAKSA